MFQGRHLRQQVWQVLKQEQDEMGHRELEQVVKTVRFSMVG
jgi:hypothetical protein